MDLVFCGTPQFAVPTLNALIDAGHRIQLVVCQPDRPSGRGQQLTSSAVKKRALELGLRITQPPSIKNNTEFRAELERISPRAIIVVAYGRIIPKWMLELAPLGNLNLHASLLTKYRGAAPIQWAIANGEQVTGVTTMRLEEGLDTGPILLQRELEIGADETAEGLSPRLAETGAALMVETLRELEAETLKPKKQDDSEATLAPLLRKEDGRIDFSRSAQTIYNRLRGFTPWPGAFTRFRGKQLHIAGARPLANRQGEPGRLHISQQQIFISCGASTALEVLEVQPEGKRRMSAPEFISGYRPQDGETLGS